MTRDEIRGLIGAYATGSLSADERKALFEAALDDQELFDELAREQALKEMLDEPGVKTRLLAALVPRQKYWWTRAWVWAAAGAFAVAIIAGIVLFRTQPPQELARVSAPPAPMPPRMVAPPARIPPAAPPAIVPPAAIPPATVPPAIVAPVIVPKAAPAIPAPAPTAAAPPPPATQPASDALVVNGTVSGTGPLPLAAGGGGGGRGGGRGGAASRAMLRTPAAMAPARFAFDYSVSPEGVLRITPAAPGFLTVSVNSATASTQLFSGRPVQPGLVNEIALPDDAVLATVTFAAQAAAADASSIGALGQTGIGGAIDPPSGTKSDPNPSPNSRLTAVIAVKR
jgi:hypothetical protein